MLDNVISKVVLTVIRRGFLTVGGGLVTHGLMTQSQENQAIGALMTLVPIAFSVWNQVQLHNAQKAQS